MAYKVIRNINSLTFIDDLLIVYQKYFINKKLFTVSLKLKHTFLLLFVIVASAVLTQFGRCPVENKTH